MADETLITALREICAIAPPLSEEATELSENDPHERACPWRGKVRDAQRIARVALNEIGEADA